MRSPAPGSPSYLRNEIGMTLIEVMVSVFVMSIVMLGLASNMDIYQREISKVQTKASRTDLSTALRTQVKDSASLYNSADMPGSSALKNCLMGVGITPCTHNSSGEFVFAGSQRTEPVMSSASVQAVDASGNPIFSAPAIGGVSSTACPTALTAAYPVFYKTDGTRCKCSDAANLCPIQIVSKYTVFCQNGATCSRPSGVRLSYDIKRRPDLPANTTTASFKTESGQYFFELNDDDYYIKTTYAASTQIDPVTLEKLSTVSYSLAEQEVRQGQTLLYRQPSLLEMSFAYLSPENVSKFRVKRFVYPAGCSTANLGTVVTVGSVTADCRPPNSSGYVFLKDVVTLAPRTGVITTNDVLSSDQVAEYQIESLRADGTTIAVGRIPLRAAFAQDGYVNVTPPASIRFVCNPTSTLNSFRFIVNSSTSGWESINATVNPPLSFGGVSYPVLPGFNAINKNVSTPQDLVVDAKYFTPGASYEITFTGVTGDHQTRIDRKTFVAGTRPARTITFTNPFSGSKVRTVSSLTTSMTINLACGETPSDVKVNVTQPGNPTPLMADQDIGTTCTATSGAIDENKFVCTKAFTCPLWLGVPDSSQCLTKFGTDTALVAKATITNASYANVSQTTSFIAGSMISAHLVKNSIRNIYLKAAAPGSGYSVPGITGVDVVFSSPLISGETAPVKLVNASDGTSTTFTCQTTGSSNTSYSGSTCTLKLPTPAVSTIYTLASASPVVEIQSPSTFTVQLIGEEMLSCSVAPSATRSCNGGRTLKRKLTAIGTQDAIYDQYSSTGILYTLAKPNADLDFFTVYRPTSEVLTPNNVGVELNFGLSASDNLISYFTPTDMTTCAAADTCAGGYSYLPPSLYDSKRIYGTTVTIRTRVPVNASRDVLLIRECYCE